MWEGHLSKNREEEMRPPASFPAHDLTAALQPSPPLPSLIPPQPPHIPAFPSTLPELTLPTPPSSVQLMSSRSPDISRLQVIKQRSPHTFDSECWDFVRAALLLLPQPWSVSWSEQGAHRRMNPASSRRLCWACLSDSCSGFLPKLYRIGQIGTDFPPRLQKVHPSSKVATLSHSKSPFQQKDFQKSTTAFQGRLPEYWEGDMGSPLC